MRTDSIIVVDELFGRVYALLDGRTLIGRSDECDIVVARGSISERHAALDWDGSELWVSDLGSTNGTAVLSRAAEPRSVARRTRLDVGDRIVFGGLGRLAIHPGSWLGEQAPGELRTPVLTEAEVTDIAQTVQRGGDLCELSPAARDAAWIARYARWRRAPDVGNLFDEGSRMCSTATLVQLRAAIDDPVRWFVNRGVDVVRMLARARESAGVLLALDARLRHDSRIFREVAGSEVRRLARKQGLNVSTLATNRLLEVVELTELQPVATALAADVIESARREGEAWTRSTWSRLMDHQAFADAASDVVFEVRNRGVTFRPVGGELLGLSGVVRLQSRDHVAVAPVLENAWGQHLAEYEVVQAFPQ